MNRGQGSEVPVLSVLTATVGRVTERPFARRPTRPCDAFPDKDWRRWREHVLVTDIEVLYAAATAETLAALLQKAQEDSGESLRAIARRIGLSATTISDLARCVRYPTLSIIARLEEGCRRPIWPAQIVYQARDAARAPEGLRHSA